MKRIDCLLVLMWLASPSAIADIIRVPEHFESIQAAIDASEFGDSIVVAPGRYVERIRLREGITLRSAGDDSVGDDGLKRAEMTIIDGGGAAGNSPGVVMAHASEMNGFTITHVGVYDDATWQRHFDSHGEELGDDEGSVQAEGTASAISVRGVSCVVTHCIVHHNGDVGIGILGEARSNTSTRISDNLVYRNLGGGIGIAEGAQAVIEGNRCSENLRAGIGCRAASPMIIGNVCNGNIRAGIGCREQAAPIIRGNSCFQNRRAGIGIRMKGTAPTVQDNECYENEMAGIGSRDGASPLLNNNRCHHNKMAGIGCDGSTPVIIGNVCRENAMAGIGLRSEASALIHGNQCDENKLVAIGVTQGSTATIVENRLVRSGGVPPIVAVKDHSNATIYKNHIAGGGVAAVLVQGSVTIDGNTFIGAGEKQGNAVWVWKGSTVGVSQNGFDGYRTAVHSVGASIDVIGNTIHRFTDAAILVKESTNQANVYGNLAVSSDPSERVLELQGPSGVVRDNLLKQSSPR